MFQPTNQAQRDALRAYQNALQDVAFTPGARLDEAAAAKAAAIQAGMTLRDCDVERYNEAAKVQALDPVNLAALLR
jgi:hypothetical protein